MFLMFLCSVCVIPLPMFPIYFCLFYVNRSFSSHGVFNFAFLKENVGFYGAKSCENEIYSQSILPFSLGL